MIVGTNYFWSKTLAAMADHTAAGNFDGPLSPTLLTLRLMSAPAVLSRNTVLTDLAEATFDGYAAVSPVVWLSTYQLATGAYVLQSQITQFLATGNVVLNTLYGWWIETSADSGKLLVAELFPAPIGEFGLGFSLNLTVPLQVGDPGNLLGVGEVV